MPSVSDYIKLSADENIIKEYRGFEMKKPQKAVLNIAVTSKRLIFYGMTKAALKMNRPSLTQEMRIEDIRGLEIYEKKKQNMVLGILGALIFLAGLFGIYSPTTSYFYNLSNMLASQIYGGLIVALAGLIIFFISFAAGGKVTAVVLKGKNENLNSGIFQEKTLIKWGRDSEKILCELGSLILDIQNDAEGITGRIEKEDYSSDDYEEAFESSEKNHSDSAEYSDADWEEETGEKKDDYLF
ncbi:MAG: hypothetical protein JXQ82_09450 [Methanomicrobiaceae archaeon]|nr:hypothetical protein [Methanomicrobiaceae archaeon]